MAEKIKGIYDMMDAGAEWNSKSEVRKYMETDHSKLVPEFPIKELFGKYLPEEF